VTIPPTPSAVIRRPCPVCEADALEAFQQVRGTHYDRCLRCQATVMNPDHWLSAAQEREVYRLHDNDPLDAGYRRFLARLADPLLERLEPGSRGLDFGCGPGPALAGMLEEAGMTMALYDPFFQPDPEALSSTYDFVTCTEVVEHLHAPAQVFRELDRLVSVGGWLAVMTCFQTDDRQFANWHYRRDPTHVVFYRESTMAWLARDKGWDLYVPSKDVALFHKR